MDIVGGIPQVSVLTAAFDPDPGYLADAYRSLLDQDDVDWQWIIQVDGPAIDVIPARIRQDRRVEVAANGQRAGTATTRNYGLLRCECDLVQVLDADDWFYPNAIAQLAAAIRSDLTALAFGQSHHYDRSGWVRQWQPAPWPEGVLPPGTIGDTWLATGRHHVTLSASMWRTVHLHAVGGWAAMVGMQDVSMLLAITETHPATYLDLPILYSRVHTAQSTAQPAWTGEAERRHRSMVASRLLANRALDGQPSATTVVHDPHGSPIAIPEPVTRQHRTNAVTGQPVKPVPTHRPPASDSGPRAVGS